MKAWTLPVFFLLQIAPAWMQGPVFTAKDVIDFGTIYTDEDNGIRELEFKNTGNEPLILTNVKSSCGCLVPYWPKEPIMPGETAIIKAKYNVSRIGPIYKTITVTTNEIEEVNCLGNNIYKNHTIKVLGKVLPPPGPQIGYFAHEEIDFGNIFADEDSGMRLYELKNEGDADLLLYTPDCSNPGISVLLRDPVIKPGETGYIMIISKINQPGEFKASVSIATNQVLHRHPMKYRNLEIEVTGNILKE